jgi:hypothetical protein
MTESKMSNAITQTERSGELVAANNAGLVSAVAGLAQDMRQVVGDAMDDIHVELDCLQDARSSRVHFRFRAYRRS